MEMEWNNFGCCVWSTLQTLQFLQSAMLEGAAGVVEWNSGLEMQGAGNEPLLLCGAVEGK